MKQATTYSEIDGRSPLYLAMLGLLGLIVLVGAGAALFMEHHGHYVTGMNNQVVWGMPHVFAVFLIVAASGALNIASIGTVFGKVAYKPLGRLSSLLALALLAGGLAVLALDLGRPDRLIIAMTQYNFKSIFAWNMILYSGFFAITAVYLWFMMERKMNAYYPLAGYFAFFWRLALTTGTGSIFGFLVAREAYDSAIMAPMFVIMSFAFGLAIFLLVLMVSYRFNGRPLGDQLVQRLKNLLGLFVAAVMYFVLVYHLTNLYRTGDHDLERFLLIDGGLFPLIFWLGQIVIGGVLPLTLFYLPITGKSRFWIGVGALLVVVGGMAQIYIIIIGGQAYPLELFPGMEVSSSFFDGTVGHYQPSTPEFLLGLGGMALALLLTALAVKVLRFLPDTLADDSDGA